MARPWVMLHTKALDSYTLSQLSDKAYRGFMEVLMLAGRVDDDGYIGEREEIAFALRRSNEDMSEIFNELQPKGLIDYSDRGWFIENWAEHQPATTSTERVRKSRAKKAQSSKNEGANSENVTRNVTETSTERDSNAIEEKRIYKNIKDNKDIVSLSDTKKNRNTPSLFIFS